MKKVCIILLSLLVFFGVAGAAHAAGQATLTFAPNKITANQGESFNIDIIANPNGESIDTVRAFISFSADKLEITNFALGNLFPNVSPGNIIDNRNGYISEGGFRKGDQTKEKGRFGTITFKAKSSGAAIVKLIEGTRLISIGQEKVNLAALGQAEIIIKAVEEMPEFIPEVSKVEVPLQEGKSGYLQVTSSTHPNQNEWYGKNQVAVNWQTSGESKKEISNYLYKFDQNPNTNPDQKLNKEDGQKTFENVQDGVWYFHLKIQYADKSFSESVHFKIMADATAPNAVVPVLTPLKVIKGETVDLRFSTTDDASGIAFYEVGVDKDFSQQRSPYKIESKNLSIGKHKITVKAVDWAGNFTAGEAELAVEMDKTVLGEYVAIAVLVLIVLLIIVIKKRRRI